MRLNRPAFITLGIFIFSFQIWYQETARAEKKIVLRRIQSSITIDGIPEPVWDLADSTADFIQFRPYFNTEPSAKTVARLLTTDDALYGLILCHQDPEQIHRHTGVLDDSGGDVVSLMLDTFNDRRTAYKFAVSACGVRADCRLLDDGRDRDYSWDGVWFSAAKIYDWGFVVEMEIPYRSLRYDGGSREWGVDIDRWISARSEDIYWCSYEQNEGQRISKFGRLIFEEFYPLVRGLNLEIYPVGLTRAETVRGSDYDLSPQMGVDLFYNPSQSLTLQLTANPDFAQIEADPFTFNITRYESYFEERRPFFTEGSEVFMPSGRERNSGFYEPLELFYSRRIGNKLPDGGEIPIHLGTRAFGRTGRWEYGGFLALTGEKEVTGEDSPYVESRALFSSVRMKRQILGNSSIGMLYVGKNAGRDRSGVFDVDGAFRASDWQLAYQLAHAYDNAQSDMAASACLKIAKPRWIIAIRGKHIGDEFQVDDVGYVPWKGTSDITLLTGPRWYFDKGAVKQALMYMGGMLYHEKVDAYTDRVAAIGFSMELRANWGWEISLVSGLSKDQEVKYTYYGADLSSWFRVSPRWEGRIYSSAARTYNFAREYLANYASAQSEIGWRALKMLSLGTTFNVYVEWNPDDRVEEITYNSRPFISATPVNNLNMRFYFDTVYVRSSGRIEQIVAGFLFSYNFQPKSWLYLAINEIHDLEVDGARPAGRHPAQLRLLDRASVFKIKYLLYF